MEGIWGIVTILGPVLLGAVLLWAMIRNRQQSTPQSEARTERATREFYDRMDREDKARE
ncbi:MAG: hypothetical protein QM690_05710 [Sphingobium sp.]